MSARTFWGLRHAPIFGRIQRMKRRNRIQMRSGELIMQHVSVLGDLIDSVDAGDEFRASFESLSRAAAMYARANPLATVELVSRRELFPGNLTDRQRRRKLKSQKAAAFIRGEAMFLAGVA